jgi:hypothetical protein
MASARKTKTKIATIDDYYFQNRTSVKSNIKVTGNANPEDVDLLETSVAFSRVVAG